MPVYQGSLVGDIDFSAATLLKNGVWTIEGITGTALADTGVDYGVYVYLGNSNYGAQIAFSLAWGSSADSLLVYRLNWGYSFSPWRKVTFTT